MEKSDFKVVYNLTKNFNQDEFKNILKNVENSELKDIVSKYGKNEVENVINKIKNFNFGTEDNSLIETSELEDNNIDTDMLSQTSELNTELLSETSDNNINEINTELLSETSIDMVGGSDTESDINMLSETSHTVELKEEFDDVLDIDSIDDMVDNFMANTNIESKSVSDVEFNITNFI